MSPDLPDRLESLSRDLAALFNEAPAPLRTRLSALAARLTECAELAAQAQRDQTGRRVRVTALADELRTLAAPATTPSWSNSPAMATFQPDARVTAPVAPAPMAQTPVRPATTAAGPGRAASQHRIVAEDVWLISHNRVSPTCEAFIFEITAATGGTETVRLEVYRLDGKTFVKTRHPLGGTSGGWLAGKDSHGAFFLCHQDKIAGTVDTKLRAAADFALN